MARVRVAQPVRADWRLDAGARGGALDDAQHRTLGQANVRLAAGEDRIVGAGVAAQGQ